MNESERSSTGTNRATPATSQSSSAQQPPPPPPSSSPPRQQQQPAQEEREAMTRTSQVGHKTTPPARPLQPLQVRSPHAPATMVLFDSLRKGKFSDRQKESLARHETLGPMYAAVLRRCEPIWTSNNRTRANKEVVFGACSSRVMCPDEFTRWAECQRGLEPEDDPGDCHEFKEDADRCGVKISQQMVRAALADDWW